MSIAGNPRGSAPKAKHRSRSSRALSRSSAESARDCNETISSMNHWSNSNAIHGVFRMTGSRSHPLRRFRRFRPATPPAQYESEPSDVCSVHSFRALRIRTANLGDHTKLNSFTAQCCHRPRSGNRLRSKKEAIRRPISSRCSTSVVVFLAAILLPVDRVGR